MKPEIMAEGPRCKRRKQANPRRKNVLSYENVVEAGSETDEEDRLLVSEDGGLADGSRGAEGGTGEEDEEAGGTAGVPVLEASPRVAHALLSYRDQEDLEGQEGVQNHQWRFRDESNLNGSDDRKDEYEALGPETGNNAGEINTPPVCSL